MATTSPDLVVEWGIRETLSLTGILITTVAYWCAGRKWDDEGLAAYETAVDECTGGDYRNVEEGSTSTPKKLVTNADGSRDAISVNTEDYREPNDPTNTTLVVPMEHLNKAMSKHYGMIIGTRTSHCLVRGVEYLIHSIPSNHRCSHCFSHATGDH